HWFRGLGRLIASIRPDIVHMEEEPYNLATALALRAAKRAAARTVFFTWQNLNRRYPLPFRLLERYCYRAANHAIAGNRDAERVLRAKGYAGPIAVLPQFGVDENRFRPGSGRPPVFNIGYVGRFVPGKAVDLLLRAAAGLPGEWRLSLLGSGTERKALARLSGELGIADRVTWQLPVSSGEVPRHLQGLSCLVLPSISLPNWVEQFGRVLIEAMACGVPVIGSDSGEIPHVIGDAGLVFSEGDAGGLRDHLARLQAEPGLAEALGELGRQRVLEHFTQASIARRTAAVYAEMMSRR
ncbi:MAG: glycosyltransferase family 4 protein, partial [Chloroflexi bacterium]|nr:glycosyltransferase family 4 protein [Chloroflexota bacterium]